MEPKDARCEEGTEYIKLEDREILRVRSSSGEGTMTFYKVFPGISIAYNDFNMEACDSGVMVSEEVLCIDHCLEGRIEQPVSGGAFRYVAPGDIKMDDRTRHTGRFVLPLGHYRGITVSVDIARAEKPLASVLGGFPVDVRQLRARFCRDGDPLVMHGVPGVEHIFSELYEVPAIIREPYCKIKVLELLLFLQALNPSEEDLSRSYFHRTQVDKVKAARDFMMEDLTCDHTIEELAKRVGLSPTAFKSCFKGVYGTPPYAHLRALRVERAAQMLRETSMCVADVGMSVGYDSPSKFTAAFRTLMGCTPTTYRRDQG